MGDSRIGGIDAVLEAGENKLKEHEENLQAKKSAVEAAQVELQRIDDEMNESASIRNTKFETQLEIDTAISGYNDQHGEILKAMEAAEEELKQFMVAFDSLKALIEDGDHDLAVGG